MDEYQVVFTSNASDDLERIASFISLHAQHFGLKLLHRALSLSDSLICQSGSQFPHRTGVRKIVEGSYLILYPFEPERNLVRVLRFWHGAQSQANLYLEDENRNIE